MKAPTVALMNCLTAAFVATAGLGASYPDRPEFIRRSEELPTGARVETVLERLGTPDVIIRTSALDSDHDAVSQFELWNYGVNGDGFPTLGQFGCQAGRLVFKPKRLPGMQPPVASVIGEQEVRDLICALSVAPRVWASS